MPDQRHPRPAASLNSAHYSRITGCPDELLRPALAKKTQETSDPELSQTGG
jgi:hypothetical protein